MSLLGTPVVELWFGFCVVFVCVCHVFVVSDSLIIVIICVTLHCLIILLMLGALIGNKEFVSWYSSQPASPKAS